MSDISDKIDEARKEGWSDFDIHRFLLANPSTRKMFDEARKEGHSDQDVLSHLGLSPVDPNAATYDTKEALESGALAVPGVDVGPRLLAAANAAKEGVSQVAAGAEAQPAITVGPPKAPEPLSFLPDNVNKLLGLTGERAPGESRVVARLPWPAGTFSRDETGNPSTYEQALDQYRGARKDYLAKHPILGEAAEVAGGLPTAMLAGGAVNAGIRGIARAAPATTGAAEYLLGNTGYTAAGEAAPGAANLVGRLAGNAAQGAVQGITGAAMQSGMSDTPLMDQLESGGAAGAVLGGPVGTAGRAVGNMLRGAPLNPNVATLADRAVNEFVIPLRSSTFTNSPVARAVEAARAGIPGSGQGAQIDAEMEGFTRAVARRIGVDSPTLDRNTIATARTQAQASFDRAAQLTNIPMDPLLEQRLQTVVHDVDLSAMDEGARNGIRRQVENILDTAYRNGHEISGENYQTLTRKGGALDRALNNSNSDVRYHAQEIRAALDDAMQFYAPPEAQEALRTARAHWKNMNVIQDIVEHLPADKQLRPVDMGKLLNEAINRNPRWSYQQQGDLGTLAEIGQNFLKKTRSEASADPHLGRIIMGADVAANALPAIASGSPLEHLMGLAQSPGQMATAAGLLAAPTIAARAAGARFVNPAARQAIIDRTLRPGLRTPGGQLVPLLGGEVAARNQTGP